MKLLVGEIIKNFFINQPWSVDPGTGGEFTSHFTGEPILFIASA